MSESRLLISGMSCGGCVAAVKGALARQPGVESAEVDLAQGAARVRYDAAQVSAEQLAAAVSQLGYGAEVAAA